MTVDTTTAVKYGVDVAVRYLLLVLVVMLGLAGAGSGQAGAQECEPPEMDSARVSRAAKQGLRSLQRTARQRRTRRGRRDPAYVTVGEARAVARLYGLAELRLLWVDFEPGDANGQLRQWDRTFGFLMDPDVLPLGSLPMNPSEHDCEALARRALLESLPSRLASARRGVVRPDPDFADPERALMEMVARFRFADRALDRGRQGLSCTDLQQEAQMLAFDPEEEPVGWGVAPTSPPLWFNRPADENGLRGGTPEQRELWMAFNMLFLVTGHVMPESCRPAGSAGSRVPEDPADRTEQEEESAAHQRSPSAGT